MEQFRYKVEGRVQGVGFRQFVYQKAQSFGIYGGHVCNKSDGSVECVAAGNKESLAQLENALRQGPAFSQVRAMHKSEYYASVGAGFVIV